MAFLLLFAATLFTLCQSKTPNFLVIVVDDLHYTQSWDHSAPTGINLAAQSVTYHDIPTPHIQEMLDDGGVIIPRTYAGGPKCSPSRFSILTGRFPSRGAFAIKTGTRMNDLHWGTTVAVPSSAIWGDDEVYNIYRTLKYDADNPYYTGMVGKWHLMSDNVADDLLGCNTLYDTPNKALYEDCTDLMKQQGFDYVDAWYFSNIPSPPDTYSHNPEWIISNAKKAIHAATNEDKPWFLYVALTLNHEPSALDALSRSFLESPKGQLTGSDIPTNSGMRARSEIWADVMALNPSNDALEEFAGTMWCDEAIGALLSYLKDIVQYDETFVFIQSDHGLAKGLLYEQGSRIPQFVRYPPLFNKRNERKTPYIMPNDFITSNVDVAAVIFELAEITPPEGYVLDGKDWSKDASIEIYGGHSSGCCTERFMDIETSHSIMTGDYQYIWRAMLDPRSSNYDDLIDYKDSKDMEQVYDLNADPNQQTNIINEGFKSDRFKRQFCGYQQSMYEYQREVACVYPDDCTYPKQTFCAPTASPTSSPTIAMCCTANVAMSFAMRDCEAVMRDYDDLMVQEDKCYNARTTGIDEATGHHVCKWVPCAQVGTCVKADEFLQEDARGDRGGGRRNKRTPRPINDRNNRERKRAPKPTKASNVPLEGCGQHLSADRCVKECTWQSGFPSHEDEEYFVDGLATKHEVNNYGAYMDGVYISLALLFAYFVYRQFVDKQKSVESVIESTPLLIEVEA